MKKIIVLAACCIFSFGLMALQDSIAGKSGMKTKKYCVVAKAGRLVVMDEGNQITGPVNLANGAKIDTNATYLQSDGIKRALSAGECIDPDGTIILPKDSKKADEEILVPDKK